MRPEAEILRARIAALEVENDELRERVLLLEAGEGAEWFAPIEFRLSPAMSRILGALLAREFCTKEHLHQANADARGFCETEIKIVDVYICKLRRRLRPFGLEIRTLWGRGYALEPESADRLRNWRGGPWI
jgi:two-component system cell cycle response regulator CtrA